MYEQNENPWGNQRPPYQQPNQDPSSRGSASNLFATAALVCAILGIVSVCCLYGAFIFGGLAIIFGLLSRGARKKAMGTARTAVLIGTAAVLISVFITAMSFISLISQYGSFQNLMDVYTYTLEHNFGIDLTPDGDSPTNFYGDSDFL